MHKYTNDTSTTLQVSGSDIRDSRECFIIIGRNNSLKEYYEKLTNSKFTPYNSIKCYGQSSLEIAKSNDSSIIVLRIIARPTSSSKRYKRSEHRLKDAFLFGLIDLYRKFGAKSVAVAPISCRNDQLVVRTMIRSIWDLSVAYHLKLDDYYGLLDQCIPSNLTVYCQEHDDIFNSYIKSGHYASVSNSWLFANSLRWDIEGYSLRKYLANRRYIYRDNK